MKISSADFLKLSLQEVADLLVDQEHGTALCKGVVDGKLCSLEVRLVYDCEGD